MVSWWMNLLFTHEPAIQLTNSPRPSHCRRRDAFARVGAAAALLRAGAQHVVVRQPVALVRAAPADRSRRLADALVLVRSAEHEVRVRAADRRAVLEEHDVRLLGMLSPLLEAVRDRGQADLVAPHALVD